MAKGGGKPTCVSLSSESSSYDSEPEPMAEPKEGPESESSSASTSQDVTPLASAPGRRGRSPVASRKPVDCAEKNCGRWKSAAFQCYACMCMFVFVAAAV